MAIAKDRITMNQADWEQLKRNLDAKWCERTRDRRCQHPLLQQPQASVNQQDNIGYEPTEAAGIRAKREKSRP